MSIASQPLHLRMGQCQVPPGKFRTLLFSAVVMVFLHPSDACSLWYHSIPEPELRDQGKVDGAPASMEYDGASEHWARDVQTFANMLAGKEYQPKIAPDEANFLDPHSVRMIIGIDYIVVENQNAINQSTRPEDLIRESDLGFGSFKGGHLSLATFVSVEFVFCMNIFVAPISA